MLWGRPGAQIHKDKGLEWKQGWGEKFPCGPGETLPGHNRPGHTNTSFSGICRAGNHHTEHLLRPRARYGNCPTAHLRQSRV